MSFFDTKEKEKEKEALPPDYTASASPGEGSQPNATAFVLPKKIQPHYVFLLDDSKSMDKTDKRETMNRWDLAKAALGGVVEIAAKSDPDGIDLYFMNDKDSVSKRLKTMEKLEDALKDKKLETFTPIGQRVSDIILEEYLPAYEAELEKGILIKPLYLIVITDGCPNESEDELTFDVFKTVADRLDAKRAHPSQVGIQLIQIGNAKKATAFLRTLDDKLKEKKGGRRDIVDTIPYDSKQSFNETFLWRVMNGATNTKVDKSKVKRRGQIRSMLGRLV